MIHRFESLGSTNTKMAEMAPALSHGDVVITDCQQAGRGQRGNSWEAQPGKNLTFSLFLTPRRIKATESFLISMAVAVGIAESLKSLSGLDILIKWPNDIYVGDKKLAGILIENALCGPEVRQSIVGIGINVNQCLFRSDAPNPVSLAILCGKEFNLDTVLGALISGIMREIENVAPDALSERYHGLLWRGSGIWPWRRAADGALINAKIKNVALSGHLSLDTQPPLSFAFKEISPVM